MRSPCAYVAAAFRATSAETDGDRPVRDFLGRTGQLLYGGVTPDGYAHREDVWLSRGAMVGRLNFAAALATKRLRCTSVNFSKVLSEVDKSSKDAAAARLIALTSGDLSATTRTAIQTSTTEAAVIKPAPAPANVPAGVSGNGNPPPPPLLEVTGYVRERIALLIGSSGFQRR